MKRLRVGLYLHDPGARIERLVRCLREWNMDFLSLWADDLARLPECDTLLLHGGWYGVEGRAGDELRRRHGRAMPHEGLRGEAIRDYVSTGGGVVGICCGAFNLVWMRLLDAEASLMEGVGPHSLEVRCPGHPILTGVARRASSREHREWLRVPVIRHNGPILFPGEESEMVMSYDVEGRLGAVLTDRFGEGRVVAISPHPERTGSDLETAIPDEPLMPVAALLRNALHWSAGRECSESG